MTGAFFEPHPPNLASLFLFCRCINDITITSGYIWLFKSRKNWKSFPLQLFRASCFIWVWNKNHFPNSHLKIWNPSNFTMESISLYKAPFRLMWYTFLNRKNSESLWFYWYCLRNEGFQIFRCEFEEWFLFHSQKKSLEPIYYNLFGHKSASSIRIN